MAVATMVGAVGVLVCRHHRRQRAVAAWLFGTAEGQALLYSTAAGLRHS